VRATDFLNDIRGIVDDGLESKFTDDYLLGQGHRKIQRMFRQMTETQEGYHFVEYDVESSALTSVDTETKELRLPPWASKVRSIRPREGMGTAASMGDQLVHATAAYPDTPSWRNWSDNRLRLHHWSGSSGLRLVIAKTPARMMRFTISALATDASTVNLPAEPDVGVMETQADWYRNERFEVLSTTRISTAHAVVGVRGYVTASTPNQVVGSALRTVLTFADAWPAILKVGDVLESVVPLPEELTRLAVLETAMICFQHHGNDEAQVAMLDELRVERRDFAAYIQQRQSQGPDYYLCEGEGSGGHYDPNKDHGYRY
jgi:hypothetical protein